ncbi:MAG: hypothetical protein CVU94_02075 [Firmicutes bacterium HGW-Firmicutes-19]|nr:MAG: hypothetical protein CVU94_02075 [Firmicutes bacterium HGW-Firmicutes-19]
MKKIIAIILVFFLVGCGSSGNNDKDPDDDEKMELLSSFTIDLNVTGEVSDREEYLVYLMRPGILESEPGKATQSGYYGPFETVSRKVVIDSDFNWDLDWYIEDATSNNEKLHIYVTSKEDIYLRNPLNDPIAIDFVENKDENTNTSVKYGVYKESMKVDVYDAYPMGVLSLTFPDATFVIKLTFDTPPSESAFEVSIHRPDDSVSNGISMFRIGRMARSFQYWDTPFFKDDNLKSWTGYIVVRNIDTNAIVEYEGYPKKVEFSDNGKCLEADIIEIKLWP